MDYTTGRWKAKRKKILKRDSYQCQYAKRFGKRVDADTVHHIYQASKCPEFCWCDWNLIALSSSSHERMHDKKSGKLTKEGEELKKTADRRRNRERIKPPCLKLKSQKENAPTVTSLSNRAEI